MQNQQKKRLVVTESAHRTILEECRRFNDVETGTVLVGHHVGEDIVVTKALLPGPKAERQPTRFSPDVEYVQRELDVYRKDHPQEDFVGVHHQHPRALSAPSYGDLQQARAILADPQYKINGRFVSVISLREDKIINLFPYVLTNADSAFRSLSLEIVVDPVGQTTFSGVDENDRVKTDSSSSHSFWVDQKFRWYQTPVGRARLEREFTAIINTLGIGPRCTISSSRTLMMTVGQVVLVFPAEYPLNPPRCFAMTKSGVQLKALRIREFGSWRSDVDLVDILRTRQIKRHWDGRGSLLDRGLRRLRWISRTFMKGASHDQEHRHD